MPQYYGGTQGPAQYAMHQQSRQDQQMQNLLRMMMQMKAMKQSGGQWEQEQAMKQQRFGLDIAKHQSLEDYRKSTVENQESMRDYQKKLLDLRKNQVTSTRDKFNLLREVGMDPQTSAKLSVGWRPQSQSSQELTRYQQIQRGDKEQSTIRSIIKDIKSNVTRFKSEIARSYIGEGLQEDKTYKAAMKVEADLTTILATKTLTDSHLTKAAMYADLLAAFEQQQPTGGDNIAPPKLDINGNPIK